MGRHGIAAVIGLVYVVCAAWLVHGMGQAHREGLRQSVALAAQTASPPLPAPESAPQSPPPAPRKAEPPAPAPPAEKRALPSNSPPTPPPPAPPTAPPNAAEAPQAEPAREAPKAAEPPKTQPQPPQQPPQRPRGPDPWADLAHLTTEDEKRLGQQLNQIIMTYNRPQSSGPWLQRVVELSRPLAETCTRKDIDYKFIILDSDEVNAFSHPGGYIYITRGLFDLIGEDEDYALEFVIGHEMAHVDLKHAQKCLEGKNVAVSERGISTVEQFYLLIAFGYPEEQEFEADKWIFQRMRKRDRTKRESLAFLRKFEGYAKSRGFENGRQLPPEKSESPAVENHYRAHPPAWDRRGRLETLAGKTPAPAASPRR